MHPCPSSFADDVAPGADGAGKMILCHGGGGGFKQLVGHPACLMPMVWCSDRLATAGLVAAALPRGLLAETVARDAAGMAVALNRLVGGAGDTILKIALEIVGQNRCRRW